MSDSSAATLSPAEALVRVRALLARYSQGLPAHYDPVTQRRSQRDERRALLVLERKLARKAGRGARVGA